MENFGEEIFVRVVGIWGGVLWPFKPFSKLKTIFCIIKQPKSKLAWLACKKSTKLKTIVLQQWQQLEMKYLLGYNMKMLFRGGINYSKGSRLGRGIRNFSKYKGGWVNFWLIPSVEKILYSPNFINIYLLNTCYLFKAKLSIIVNGALAFGWKVKLILVVHQWSWQTSDMKIFQAVPS